MTHLYQLLAEKVRQWREADYLCGQFPAIAEILQFQTVDDTGKIKVDIEDFISPTILKRLDMDLPLFRAKITDWRSQVDCVMIDTAYNGEVFNVVFSDVPKKKNDLTDGAYTLPIPDGKTMVAVKLIDIWL